MARNTLGDLNNHLFEELERLNNEELAGEKLETELERAKAITSVAQQIISNANTILQAKKFQAESLGRSKTEMPKMLEG